MGTAARFAATCGAARLPRGGPPPRPAYPGAPKCENDFAPSAAECELKFPPFDEKPQSATNRYLARDLLGLSPTLSDVATDHAEPALQGRIPMHTESLYQNRNKVVAKSFYRRLKTEGFTHEQIIELSTTLLDLVSEDLRKPAIAEAK